MRQKCIWPGTGEVGGRTHGHTGTPTYRVWSNMPQRCLNKKHPRYKDYGGRGITICERWSEFANFLSDMGTKPLGLSIDRRDNNGNYEPRNCHWTTSKQQRVNQTR